MGNLLIRFTPRLLQKVLDEMKKRGSFISNDLFFFFSFRFWKFTEHVLDQSCFFS